MPVGPVRPVGGHVPVSRGRDSGAIVGMPMKLKIVLEPSDEGGYTVYVPGLPGCISEGETVDDAIANIREAIELYVEPVESD